MSEAFKKIERIEPEWYSEFIRNKNGDIKEKRHAHLAK